ncbi:MAG: adenylate/guanylate cyclase domain-containing protein, partial [Chitinophagaceae bacterium]
VHTGPLVAGVVGRRKYSYDIWGETVTIAGLMEQHSKASGINISADTVRYLNGAYDYQPNGEQETGEGRMMAMYQLEM